MALQLLLFLFPMSRAISSAYLVPLPWAAFSEARNILR